VVNGDYKEDYVKRDFNLKHARLKLAPCSHRSRGGAVLVVCLAGIMSTLCTLPCLAQTPTITSVSKISTAQFQTITIKGSGFGTQAPYTGDSPYIALLDTTASPEWQAGYSGYNDTVTLIVNSWTKDKIVLGGFSGAWGEAGYDYTLNIGDSEQISVWNPQSGNGPATITATVIGEKTTTTLTSSPNPSTDGESVTFTASVSSSEGAPPDGETVAFMHGKTVLGTGTLSSGSATFMTSTLKVGTTPVQAVYGGDSDFDASKSKVVKQVVGAD
jgi:hypothetical protein